MAKTQGHGNPKWTREETILALDLYFKLNGKIPDESDARIIELSMFLQTLPRASKSSPKESFRNRTGITFKLQNLRQLATGKGFGNVSQTDRDIWERYGADPFLVNSIATQIRENVEKLRSSIIESTDDTDFEFSEGALLTRLHKLREREPSVRKYLLSRRKETGELKCDLCGFRGLTNQPELIESQFEAHHIVPLSHGSIRNTKLSEIALLCANCHRLIHKVISKKKDWVTVVEMKELIAL